MSENNTEKQNRMKEVFVDKVIVNIGVGEGGPEVDNAAKILKLVTKKPAVKTKAKVKLPTWGIRPGLEIGVKTTLRGKEAVDFIKLVLKAKNNRLKEKTFSNDGNFSFGVAEYLDVPGIKYDPELGIRGFDVCVSLKKRGYRVKQRKYQKSKLGKNQLVTKKDAKEFAINNLGVEVI